MSFPKLRKKRQFCVAMMSLFIAIAGSTAMADPERVGRIFANIADHFFWYVASLQMCGWMISEYCPREVATDRGVSQLPTASPTQI